MRYISTRGQAPVLEFDEVLLAGLARDGGLYVPEVWPKFSADEIRSLLDLSYPEMAMGQKNDFLKQKIEKMKIHEMEHANFFEKEISQKFQ